jgi:hypothetical protein
LGGFRIDYGGITACAVFTGKITPGARRVDSPVWVFRTSASMIAFCLSPSLSYIPVGTVILGVGVVKSACRGIDKDNFKVIKVLFDYEKPTLIDSH